MSAFQASRDIKINGVQEPDGSVTLVSDGLAKQRLPELEIVGAPVAHAKQAAVIINHIADYMANKKRIKPGELIGISSDNGSLVARLVENGGRLRIEEPLDGMPHLLTMISTILLWQAAAAVDADENAAAIAILESAIELFPGNPDNREAPEVGIPLNWENHLAYLRLSELVEGADSRAAIAKAIARCDMLEVEWLGDSADEIAAIVRDAFGLQARADEILKHNARDAASPDEPGMRMALSPIWHHADGNAVRRMNVLPCAPYPALANPALVGIAIEWLSNADPLDIALFSRDTAAFWEGGSDGAPEQPTGQPYRIGDYLLSRALAHVARLVAADLTADEIRAACELSTNAAAATSARAKLTQLEAAETDAMMAAMRMNMPD